ncbi:hypothetical protein SFRURICE_004779 [Spodoptera frugiperda]|nr:hypothetical protein SFRURICE_004779 [Spodoptera frugiperda]
MQNGILEIRASGIAQRSPATVSAVLRSSPPDQNPCVWRVAFRARLKVPPDHHRWGLVRLTPDPELRTI